jgi:hypothetical protein
VDKDKYTKPALRERIKRKIMASSKGGKPGQWSARKSQMLVKQYEAAGGGYKKPQGRTSAQRSLSRWTKQDWQSAGKNGVYLPKRAISALKSTPSGRKKLAAANRSKRRATSKGRQTASHGLHKGKRR